jgi:hypothetical protein
MLQTFAAHNPDATGTVLVRLKEAEKKPDVEKTIPD